MKRKALRTLPLVVIVCCLYSVYKVPSLYWSLKMRLPFEKHYNVGVETNSERGGILVNKDNTFNQNSLVETFQVHEQHKAIGVINKSKTLNEVTDNKTNESGLKLRLYKSRIEDEKQSEMDVSKPQSTKIHHQIDTKELSDYSEGNDTYEEETSSDLRNDQYEDVSKETKESAEIHYNYKKDDEERFDGQFDYEKEDVEFDINEVNAHRKVSENVFKTFPNYQNATKYLVYYCGNKCGGLGDRLKGISTVYMMSILTERRFAISMRTPCEIDRFLQPNLLNWEYPAKKEIIGKTLQTIDCFERHEAFEIYFQKNDPDPKTMMEADVVHMKANQYWTRIFRKMSVSPKRFPQLYQYHSSELFKTIFNGLFKLSPELKDFVDDFFTKNVNGKKLACLHARMGEEVYKRYTYREIMIPLQFLKRFDSLENYKILVATDTENVKTIAKHLFKNFVDTSGPILHIDYMLNGTMTQDRKCAGFMRSMVDHTVLQSCDQLVLTGSGFGVSAASIRHTSRGLYVYIRGEAVMPTKRELVRETFQWRCLSRSWEMKFYRNICDS